MSACFETSPAIYALLDRYRPKREPGRRIITIERRDTVDRDFIGRIAGELRLPEVMSELDGGEVASLAVAAASARWSFGDDCGAGEALQRLRKSRNGEIDVDIAIAAIARYGINRDLLTVFPDLVGAPAMIEGILIAAEEGSIGTLEHIIDVDALVISDLEQARRALSVRNLKGDNSLATYLVAAAARGLGWTAWLKLFAILSDERGLAGETLKHPLARPSETPGSLKVRGSVWRQILPDLPVRHVAQLILDLEGTLSTAGPDMRAVFVERLRGAIAGDGELRRAAVEALINYSPDRPDGLALYAAMRLVEPHDQNLVSDLAAHPDREIGYAADMVRRAVFEDVEIDEAWPAPGVNTIASGLFAIGLSPPVEEEPRTWLGDRLLERLIERTLAGEERRFAQEFPDHSEEGEESLLRSLFSDLAHRLRSLDQGLRAMADASGSGRATGIELSYRPVDKWEESRPGVNPRGYPIPPAFSADLCLIVDPYLEGRPLGKRATLVQAKRLRRKKPTRPELGFASSFSLDLQQTADLISQTQSSFMLFQCPGLLDRGIPVLPTQLAEDLARHHAPSAKQIPSAVVGPASWGFAEWLTYSVLALRTGDPLAELVAKAEGEDGRRSRPLARFGTVEIAVRVAETKPTEG